MKPSIEEIPDKEEHLNLTQQPLDVDELLVLISTITGDIDDATWFNSKSTMATRIQAEINQLSKHGTEVKVMNGRGFNFDVAPSLVWIGRPLI